MKWTAGWLAALIALGTQASGAQTPPTDTPTAEATITVTATRLARPLSDVPATVVVLPQSELERSPALTLDSVLRTVPSVEMFRRTPSLTADPSSQGLNLRGLGPSGVSRALVLVDGIPVNDPFGGWVYWRSLPRLGLSRAEVALGGASALYGSAALGGVVELFTRAPVAPSLDALLEVGSLVTEHLDLRGADRWGPVGAAVEAELLSSGGYTPVVPAARGAIDIPAASDHVSSNARVDWELSPHARLSAQGSYFLQSQNGGTALTQSTAEAGSVGLRALVTPEDGAQLDARAYLRESRFIQLRSRIAPARATESLAAVQDIPSDEEGVALVYSPRVLHWGGVHRLDFGGDGRRVHGVANEALTPSIATPGALTLRRSSGEQFGGLFVEDLYTPTPAVEISAALRLDAYRDLLGARTQEAVNGSRTVTSFPDRGFTQLDPRLGVRWSARPWLTLRASGYRAFRAPTLNELYRPFQVGTLLTAPNDALQPESLWGGELGAEVVSGPWVARATGFWSALYRPVVNVSLAAPLADGSTRERQNLGRADIRGVELALEGHLAPRWTFTLAYTYVDARVAQAAQAPQLVGKVLAQDPAHRAVAAVVFDDPKLFTALVQLRYVGPQFEDDLNQLGMSGAFYVDASISRKLLPFLEAYLSGTNLTNQRYLVGRSGVDTEGPPLMAMVGLRLKER